ncbi:hypothetical protein AB3S75_018533 [Citrus x aurantiifolia]
MMKQLVIVFLLIRASVAQNRRDTGPAPAGDPVPAQQYIPPPKNWLTLNGSEPVVIARGGSSGVFPESSSLAYIMAKSNCLSNAIMLCNLQFSKDGLGVCLSDVRLNNITTINGAFKDQQTTKNINGNNVRGWFSVDYTLEQLGQLYLVQNVYTRSEAFDNTQPIPTPDTIVNYDGVSNLWLNVPYDLFYSQHNISAAKYITEYLQKLISNVYYISSPEIGFLKTMGRKVDHNNTMLVFMVLEPNAVEPTTNQTYGSILKNLTAIKSFASGIVVPKSYIIPVNNKTRYLEPATTLVTDAHNAGLQVYASGFANDIYSSYSYNFEPEAEYLTFIDNSQFAVDGFITDFPTTATEAIVCFALTNLNETRKDRPLIITHNGASGVYAGCTDLAYQQAVDDGADIIDCTVQMSKDGVAFCLESPDLIGKTTAATVFMSKATSVPEIQKERGIFSFDLTWTEIQSLKPQISSPFDKSNPPIIRNPEAKNKGKFVTLDGFLEFAKTKAVSGVLININNAAYLASKKGLGVVDAVTKALSNATFDKQSTQQVMIQSDDSSVLSKFKDVPAYKKVLHIRKEVSAAPREVVEEIKKYANAVTVTRTSVISTTESFTTNATNILRDLHSANISVYISALRNEYLSIAFDYLADPLIEVATFAQGVGVDGITTEFPATASKYFRSKCSDDVEKQDFRILPVVPGELLDVTDPKTRPNIIYHPALTVADIVRPPLPPVTPVSQSAPGSSGLVAPAPQGGVPTNVANIGLTLAAIMLFCLLSMGH